MPRPVETLDVALPADHPLKRPVSSRNKQAAQRIYQLWNVWPWQLFHTSSPHMPTTWTDNLLDKLKTIALCTTLPHALQLLKVHLADSQQLSIAPLNAVIEACKESGTPPNPVVKNRKRKQGRTIVVQYGSDGYENHPNGTGSGHEDLEEETDEASDDDEDDSNEEIGTYQSRLRRRQTLIPAVHRARGNSLPSGYGLPRKSKVPPSKRPKHWHERVSTPAYLGNASSPAQAPASFPSPRPSAPAPSSMRRFDSEGPTRPSSLGGVASYIETTISQLSSSFQEKFHGAEQTVDDARSQLRMVEARLVSLENELEGVKKDIVELERQKSEMESTYGDLLGIEKEEEELAMRRRELMTRRMTAHWRPSSSTASSSEQPQPQPSLSITRASDDLLAEINNLVTDRLQPRKDHAAALRDDISNTHKEAETIQGKVDASVLALNAKSDELIRWRGFSSDVHDALIRRGFAELAFMREFGPNLYYSRAATASFPSEHNRDTGAGSPEPGSTPVSQSANNDRERDRRRESV